MFEFAAAIAGVSAGLFAVSCLSLIALIAAWRMLGRSDARAAVADVDAARETQANAIADLEDAVERLDRTVGQTAAALATLVDLLERELR